MICNKRAQKKQLFQHPYAYLRVTEYQHPTSFLRLDYGNGTSNRHLTTRVVLVLNSSMQPIGEQKKQQKSFGSNGRMVRFYSWVEWFVLCAGSNLFSERKQQGRECFWKQELIVNMVKEVILSLCVHLPPKSWISNSSNISFLASLMSVTHKANNYNTA